MDSLRQEVVIKINNIIPESSDNSKSNTPISEEKQDIREKSEVSNNSDSGGSVSNNVSSQEETTNPSPQQTSLDELFPGETAPNGKTPSSSSPNEAKNAHMRIYGKYYRKGIKRVNSTYTLKEFAELFAHANAHGYTTCTYQKKAALAYGKGSIVLSESIQSDLATHLQLQRQLCDQMSDLTSHLLSRVEVVGDTIVGSGVGKPSRAMKGELLENSFGDPILWDTTDIKKLKTVHMEYSKLSHHLVVLLKSLQTKYTPPTPIFNE